ncbi:hypothetical protein FKM82_025627 [Ascaphus truei]
MTTSKLRRAYSLRISPKPAVFLDSSGVYDQLDETDCPEDLLSPTETSGNRDSAIFSWHIPLITDAPKLQPVRKKWMSRSLRLPKTRLVEDGPPASQPEEGDKSEMGNDTGSPNPEGDEQRVSDKFLGQKEVENEGEKQRSKKMKHYRKVRAQIFSY